MLKEKLGLIIPTKNRPEGLSQILESLSFQKFKPSQIVVVDGGEIAVQKLVKKFAGFPIDYVKAPCSLTIQKNAGLKALKKEISVVGFLDDDIQLCPYSIDIAMEFLLKSPDDIAGVSCNDISHPRNKTLFLEKIFLLGSDKVGVVLPSGFQSKICSVDDNYPVQWLMGGATFWKRDIFDLNKFDEWFYGYAHCEDIDFSYQISKRYKLFVLKDAKVIHNTRPVEKMYEYHLGKMQVVNRAYFVKKHPELSLILCYWACAGLLLKNIVLGTIGLRPRYLLRGLGILTGIISSCGRLDRIKAEIKL